MNRRGFLGAILAAAAAPAIVRAQSLMPVRALDSGVLVPVLQLREGLIGHYDGFNIIETSLDWQIVNGEMVFTEDVTETVKVPADIAKKMLESLGHRRGTMLIGDAVKRMIAKV